ncbi:MAG: 50S ribosomal protein L29 [Paludibacteraceae bacterium]|nr:50S ribosomal protein L29 [Paludibacteraceae bacterium]MBR2492331.1 50S ribosomal protein L29 [Paludibacteraceae bacterium]MBR3872184.1 50S ribosomal protein L29 [Paludibacteraceae bacterium]MBR6686497.1 50S ribosomal protein L29 [Paludibacteraceae bacterium]
MKTAEIKNLLDKELIERLETEKASLSKMKLSHAISPLENPGKIRETRKTIARIETELRQREINK